jgi:NAD(P)-dependent dehydrogenase (short-subunit alcohol dehydrogenase family)
VEVNGKVAVVTGAAAGIGRATAKRLAKKGAFVVVADVDADWGREAVREIRATGGQAALANFDVSTEEGVQEMIGVAVSTFGGLHILVNNAFMGSPDHFPDAPPEEWSRVLDVALRGTMLGIQYGITEMERSGYGAGRNRIRIPNTLRQRRLSSGSPNAWRRSRPSGTSG